MLNMRYLTEQHYICSNITNCNRRPPVIIIALLITEDIIFFVAKLITQTRASVTKIVNDILR